MNKQALIFWALAAFLTTGGALWVLAPLRKKILAPVLCFFLFFLALLAYLPLGRVDLPGRPYAHEAEARRKAFPQTLTFQEQGQRLRDRLYETPQDAEAWFFLGTYYLQTGENLRAVQAFERAGKLAPSSQNFSALGEALIALNEGKITPEARKAFEEALKLDPTDQRPHFWLKSQETKE